MRPSFGSVGLAFVLALAAAGGCGGDDDGAGASSGDPGGGDGGGSGDGGTTGSGDGAAGATPFDVFTASGKNASSDEAFAVGRTSDGKLVVAGTCGGPPTEENPFGDTFSYCVVRLGADGKLDAAFGAGGRVVLPSGWGARKLAVQSDGKIVLVGSSVGRLLADGKPDAAFGTGGLVADEGAANVALQGDGKIVVTGARGGLARTSRYMPDGTLDASFGTNGVVETDVTPQNDFGTAVAIQADGKIVVAGVGALGAGQRRFIVMRYLADGKLDTAFDGDGKVTAQFKGDDLARDVALDEDENVVVVGVGYPADSIVARFTPAGALDTTFNGSGFRLVASDSSCDSVATHAGGAITCGGYGLIRKYTSTGAPDGSFGGTGKVSAEIRGEDMALLPDGSVVLVGQRSGVTSDLSAVKYTSAGVLDTTFGTGGFADVDGGAAFDVATSVLGAPDGSAVLAGESALGSHFVKLGPTGALDPSFGAGGIAAFDNVFTVRGLARQASGKIVFAAWSTNVSFVVGRLDANGAMDKTFGTIGNGLVTIPIFGSAMGRGIVTDGTSIWAAGGPALAKLGVDGKLDAAFGKEGVVNPAVAAAGGLVRQPDGKLVVWSTSDKVKMLRFDPTTGAPDPSFAGGTGLAGPEGFAAAHVSALGDGKLLVTWIDAAGTTLRLERRGPDGALDASFGQAGAVTETLAPATKDMPKRSSSAVLPDGRVALVTSQTDEIVVFLYDANGARATAFAEGGRLAMRKPGARLAVRGPASLVGTTLFAPGVAKVGADAELALGRLTF